MFIDACAIVSLIAGEDSADAYRQALDLAEDAWTSALAAWEAIIVLARPDQLACSYGESEAVVTEWLQERGIALRETGSPREVLALAVKVAERHGLGKRAQSNFGCFHYAYAKAEGASLLTLDRRLRETDAEVLP